MNNITILGIESSCDDTAAAVIRDGCILSGVIADQDVHKRYGGVVPELASRAHQQNIIPVVEQALIRAGISQDEISAVAFTSGPGLMGSLLVGSSFSKGFALARKIPVISVNHLQAHILVHFIKEPDKNFMPPSFPFLCLLVSGGHTQLVIVRDHLDFEIIGRTIDDAAGEAFDKCAKVMGLTYPGGPSIDRLARGANPYAYNFTRPRAAEFDFSFSGLKTNFLYFIRDNLASDRDFIINNKADLCASLQRTIIDILLEKCIKAAESAGINEIALAGGVSANSELRHAFSAEAGKRRWKLFIPEIKYTTDNAAMIAITGYYKYLAGEFAGMDVVPVAKI
jgi:N6-L-threonylcarbamoyladenine synthase